MQYRGLGFGVWGQGAFGDNTGNPWLRNMPMISGSPVFVSFVVFVVGYGVRLHREGHEEHEEWGEWGAVRFPRLISRIHGLVSFALSSVELVVCRPDSRCGYVGAE